MGLHKTQDTAERRIAPRRRVMWGSWLVTPDGSHCVPCQTRDFSATGARVALDDQRAFPASVCFLDMRNRLAYEARIAWRKTPEMGLEFVKVYRFADVPEALRGVIEQVCQ
jgi:PilZ domain-containing protein